eukprot:1072454-Pyramimonas_sp.AAC.1
MRERPAAGRATACCARRAPPGRARRASGSPRRAPCWRSACGPACAASGAGCRRRWASTRPPPARGS